MAKNRGKKALYEVMSKARATQGYGKTLEQIHLKKTEQLKPAVEQPKPAPKKVKAAADWWKKPRIAQFNAGRFEFSVPYQVAIVLGLVLVTLLLASYRLGQNSVVRRQPAMAEPGQQVEKIGQESAAERATANLPEPALPVEYVPAKQDVPANEDVTGDIQEEAKSIGPKGKNAIVLAHSGRIVDLHPVVEHFAQHGIMLRIDSLEDGQYLLRTVQQYERNPATPGTDGFNAIREIIRVGALYEGKAPPGCDTFAPNYFSDAYGKKVED
ncbi:MAG: hypothetical protein AMJ65_13775 [Phycisphaerae bacterium SG8_4]|nr:MAG: hypothetical protein AMJ65_13775 [Phycisphaerae bacterium SG8_4]